MQASKNTVNIYQQLMLEVGDRLLNHLRSLCREAAAVTVFTPTARLLVLGSGLIDADRIVIVPHGAPETLHPDFARPTPADLRPDVARLLAEAGDARILSTFGLVSPGKGLEVAITAVAELAADQPDLRYIIAGVTHPEVARRFGEEYRDRLAALIAELGVERHVRFLDFFLTDAEIAALLHRTEVFLTPYHSREQVSSGALTFALAAGCPVVSTSYPYALDMLRGGAGRTVEPGDSRAFAAALRAMLTEPGQLQAAKSAAQQIGSTLSWPSVARRFAVVIRTIVEDSRAADLLWPQPITRSPAWNSAAQAALPSTRAFRQETV